VLLGLDHATIAVRDPARAAEQLERTLGLKMVPGGEYPDLGIQSSVALFGADYLELVSVRNPEIAGMNERGRILLDLLSRREARLLGYCLSSDDLDRDVAEARERGLHLEGPFSGSRRLPDGSLMVWRTSWHPHDPWGHLLPPLIHHDTDMMRRRRWVPPDGHPLRANALYSVALVVADRGEAVESYRRLLGEPPDIVEDVPEPPACRARFCVGSFRVEILQPTAPSSSLARLLKQEGEGTFLLGLAVPDLDDAVRFLRERGTAVGPPTPEGVAPLLDPSQTLGISFQLVERT